MAQLAMLLVGWLSTANAAPGLTLYVATDGRDAWSGTLPQANGDQTDGPFATLERARDEIRKRRESGKPSAGPVIVEIRGGIYLRDKAFELTAADGGTRESPVVYRAYRDEQVRLLGGPEITAWKPVSDPAVLERLDPAARDHVRVSDLKVQGIKDYGQLSRRGFGGGSKPAGLELFYQGRPMQLSRWPNEGWLRTVAAPAGPQGGKFTYDGDRPQRWAKAEDVWVHGFWTWDWANSYEKVRSIDTGKREITTEPPHGVYGYKENKRFHFLNLLEELDAPGEWYLDRTTGKLYFWPPAQPLESGPQRGTFVSILEHTIRMQDASHVTFQGLSIEYIRGTGITMTNGSHNRVLNCAFRNVGNSAVAMNGGTDNGVDGCDISEVGDGGISLVSGDRQTLTPGGGFVINNHIWRFSRWAKTYAPAISVQGVGNRVAHNLIHDSPHMGILLGGNEHVIEYNELHTICMETDDVGAFYMGRDWTARGNVIRYNYFHDLGTYHSHVGAMAVYLDDWSSGTTVYGNVCVRAGRAVLVGGGRNNTIENNIFVDCTPAVHVDSRGLGWAKNYFDGKTNTLIERLNAIPYRQPPWSTRYPELLTLYEDEPALAKYNRIERNICVGGRWLDLLDKLTDKVVLLKDNLVGKDPQFVDAEKRDFRLREDSPAHKLGFKPIPFEKIGLQRGAREGGMTR